VSGTASTVHISSIFAQAEGPRETDVSYPLLYPFGHLARYAEEGSSAISDQCVQS
jgi:hypothetical protein